MEVEVLPQPLETDTRPAAKPTTPTDIDQQLTAQPIDADTPAKVDPTPALPVASASPLPLPAPRRSASPTRSQLSLLVAELCQENESLKEELKETRRRSERWEKVFADSTRPGDEAKADSQGRTELEDLRALTRNLRKQLDDTERRLSLETRKSEELTDVLAGWSGWIRQITKVLKESGENIGRRVGSLGEPPSSGVIYDYPPIPPSYSPLSQKRQAYPREVLLPNQSRLPPRAPNNLRRQRSETDHYAYQDEYPPNKRHRPLTSERYYHVSSSHPSEQHRVHPPENLLFTAPSTSTQRAAYHYARDGEPETHIPLERQSSKHNHHPASPSHSPLLTNDQPTRKVQDLPYHSPRGSRSPSPWSQTGASRPPGEKAPRRIRAHHHGRDGSRGRGRDRSRSLSVDRMIIEATTTPHPATAQPPGSPDDTQLPIQPPAPNQESSGKVGGGGRQRAGTGYTDASNASGSGYGSNASPGMQHVHPHGHFTASRGSNHHYPKFPPQTHGRETGSPSFGPAQPHSGHHQVPVMRSRSQTIPTSTYHPSGYPAAHPSANTSSPGQQHHSTYHHPPPIHYSPHSHPSHPHNHNPPQQIYQNHIFTPIVTGPPVKKTKFNAATAALATAAAVAATEGTSSPLPGSAPSGRSHDPTIAHIPPGQHSSSSTGAPPFPPTNHLNQRLCRQCGQVGRYKDGKCVEKWGPGPLGPGTVCDRCRKKMKRVERRGTVGGGEMSSHGQSNHGVVAGLSGASTAPASHFAGASNSIHPFHPGQHHPHPQSLHGHPTRQDLSHSHSHISNERSLHRNDTLPAHHISSPSHSLASTMRMVSRPGSSFGGSSNTRERGNTYPSYGSKPSPGHQLSGPGIPMEDDARDIKPSPPFDSHRPPSRSSPQLTPARIIRKNLTSESRRLDPEKRERSGSSAGSVNSLLQKPPRIPNSGRSRSRTGSGSSPRSRRSAGDDVEDDGEVDVDEDASVEAGHPPSPSPSPYPQHLPVVHHVIAHSPPPMINTLEDGEDPEDDEDGRDSISDGDEDVPAAIAARQHMERPEGEEVGDVSSRG